MDPNEAHRWFNYIDADRNGFVSAPELQQALSRGGLHFSLQTVANLIRSFDKERKGCVNAAEFTQLHNFIVQTQTSFDALDTNRNKELERKEVHSALRQAGFVFDNEAFEALFTAYDPQRKNKLDLCEFLGLTLFLRCASGMFVAFDSGRQNSIRLTFSQFVYAASFCR